MDEALALFSAGFDRQVAPAKKEVTDTEGFIQAYGVTTLLAINDRNYNALLKGQKLMGDQGQELVYNGMLNNLKKCNDNVTAKVKEANAQGIPVQAIPYTQYGAGSSRKAVKAKGS